MKYKEAQKLFREHPWLKDEVCKILMITWPGREPFTQAEIANFVAEDIKGICFQDWNKVQTLDTNAQHVEATLVTHNHFVLKAYVSLELAIFYHLAAEKPFTRVWRSTHHDSGRKKTIAQAIKRLIKQDTMDAGLVFDALVVHTFSFVDGHRHTYTTVNPFPEQKPQLGLTCEEFEKLRLSEDKPLFSEPEIQNFTNHAVNVVSRKFRVMCAPYQLKPEAELSKWVARWPREEWESAYSETIQRVIQEQKEWDELPQQLEELLDKPTPSAE